MNNTIEIKMAGNGHVLSTKQIKKIAVAQDNQKGELYIVNNINIQLKTSPTYNSIMYVCNYQKIIINYPRQLFFLEHSIHH